MFRHPFNRWALIVGLAVCLLMSPAAFGLAAIEYQPQLIWGISGSDPAEFNSPRGVAVDKWGNVFVADSGNSRIQQFNSAGDFIRQWGSAGAGDGQFLDLRRVAVDRWGNVYATDFVKQSVQRFSPNGLFSQETDVAHDVTGIAVGLDGSVYVVDPAVGVRKFSAAGAALGTLSCPGPEEGVGVSQDDDVYIVTDENRPAVPTGGNRVYRYSASGSLLSSWGETGTAPGQFNRPYGASVDGAGRVFVVESENSRGQLFTAAGAYISMLSTTSPIWRVDYPYAIAAGFDRSAWMTGTFNDKIARWDPVEAPSAITTGIAGADRIETAIAASRKAYPDGADTVILATSQNWPDALGGASLAGITRAPILLTTPSTLPSDVADEIVRLGATTAYILGGESAVSADVYNQVDALMILHAPVRLGGIDRYATANLIADTAMSLKGSTYDGTAFVVTGQDFADALSVSPVAAANGWPVYLTRANELPPSVLAAMLGNGVTHGYIVGGDKAVSAAVEAGLNADFEVVPGVDMFTRYEGATRYETSAVFAEAAWNGMGLLFSRPALATGQNYPDALAGGALQGSDYCPLLLTPSTSLDPHVAEVVAAHSKQIYEMRFLGGTTALTAGVRDSAKALLP